ncbi:hypothetical protein ACFUN7_24290 [Streptomyces sp. NPDC057236]|uniref:hypothetical protein n=1 Tax=Streptomyces sp. NPDC057236 TaxID=3346059 RepID=UPI0036405B97
MTHFTGVLAVLHTPTPDGRRLDEPAAELTRPMPLPLACPGEPNIGRIDRVWRDGDLLRYAGSLDGEHPEAGEIAAEIRAGRLVGNLDAAYTLPSGRLVGEVKHRYQGREMTEQEMADLPLDADPSDVEMVMCGWLVGRATLMPSEVKSWPEVSLVLDDADPVSPGEEPAT